VNRKAADLVRLALFSEQRRAALRRDEILKKGTLVLARRERDGDTEYLFISPRP